MTIKIQDWQKIENVKLQRRYYQTHNTYYYCSLNFEFYINTDKNVYYFDHCFTKKEKRQKIIDHQLFKKILNTLKEKGYRHTGFSSFLN